MTPSALDAVVAKGDLAQWPPAAVSTLVGSATQRALRSRTIFSATTGPARCGMVLRGMVRASRLDAEGNELTLLWAHPGALFGITWAVRPPTPTTIQAVSDALVLEFPVTLVRKLAEADAAVALAIADFITRLLYRAIDEIVLYAYGDLRARVQRRLLEAACRTPPEGPLIAPLTQEDLARAVGASRQSVARVLGQLRQEGIVRSLYRGVLILRPELLAAPQQNAA